MKLRMSKAPAVCFWPGFPPAAEESRSWESLMSKLLSEQEVEDDDEAERDAGEGQRAPEPRQLVLLGVDEVLPRRLGVDQPAQLGRGLGIGHERHDDAEQDVDDEGCRCRDEGGALTLQRDDPQAEGSERVLAEEGDEHGREGS